MSIQYTALGFEPNPQPPQRESPPITTRPGLPPLNVLSWGVDYENIKILA